MGGSIYTLENYGGFCITALNISNYITVLLMFSAIILYEDEGFLVRLISHIEKLGQHDLNKKILIFVKIMHLNF